MELLETMLKRKSIRMYNEKPVTKDLLDEILTAGLLAPSSRNFLPVEFIRITDKDMLMDLSRAKNAGADMLTEASAAIVVIADHEKSDVWVEDAAIAMIYMQLRATDLGIGNCWVQCRNRTSKAKGSDGEKLSSEAYVKKLLQIPDQYSVLSILSLGMTDAIPEGRKAEDVDFKKVHKNEF